MKEEIITHGLQQYNPHNSIFRKSLKLNVSVREEKKPRHVGNWKTAMLTQNFFLAELCYIHIQGPTLHFWFLTGGRESTVNRSHPACQLSTGVLQISWMQGISFDCRLQDWLYLQWVTAYMISQRLHVSGSSF